MKSRGRLNPQINRAGVDACIPESWLAFVHAPRGDNMNDSRLSHVWNYE